MSTRVEIIKGEHKGEFGNVINQINANDYEVTLINGVAVIPSSHFEFVNPLVKRKFVDGELTF